MTTIIGEDMISKTTITILDDNEEKIERFVNELKTNNHKLKKLSIIRNEEEEIIIDKESGING